MLWFVGAGPKGGCVVAGQKWGREGGGAKSCTYLFVMVDASQDWGSLLDA